MIITDRTDLGTTHLYDETQENKETQALSFDRKLSSSDRQTERQTDRETER